MLPETLDLRKNPVTLIHHAANCGHQAPPGSLSALETCLAAGAAVVEIDIIPLADGSFALLHDQNLEADTNGKGYAPQMKRGQVKDLCYVVDGKITDEKIGFLEDAVDLLKAHPDTKHLQLDLKPYTPLTQGVLREFCGLLKPVRYRILVTSVADWAVRALARFSPNLAIGYDPLLYLDLVDNEPRLENVPPFHVGAYGLLDDHPLSAYKWGPPGDYFAARAGALLVQAPKGCAWFIRAELLKAALDAGFDWIAFLHHHGSAVDGWTIDAEDPQSIKLAQVLVEHGVDMLTTDQPSKLAQHLPSKTIL